jgi:uncharacterized protein (TIGR04551 family)
MRPLLGVLLAGAITASPTVAQETKPPPPKPAPAKAAKPEKNPPLPRKPEKAPAKSAEKPAAAPVKAPEPSAPAPAAEKPVAPAESAVGAGAAGAAGDKAVEDLIRREVEKAKDEMRMEMQAQAMGAQVAGGASPFPPPMPGMLEEAPRLELLELDGYLRTRGDLFNEFDLGRNPDPSGYHLFPRPLLSPNRATTLAGANMRFRLEPTLNVSEEVRVRAQIDMLDNLVLGSTSEGLFQRSERHPSAVFGSNQLPPSDGFNSDRDSIRVRRAWGEVVTPIGQLRFGRMGSDWGLGVLTSAGNGIDSDYGDTVDRILFALRIHSTPVGPISIVPLLDFNSEGVVSYGPTQNRGVGQVFDREQQDDGRDLGVIVARRDTDEELRQKLDKGLTSYNYGLYYLYRSQTYEYLYYGAGPGPSDATTSVPPIPYPERRAAWAHVADLWARIQGPRLRVEAELVGIYGEIGSPRTFNDVNPDPSVPSQNPRAPVVLQQFGGALQTEYKFLDGKLGLSGEIGYASGDPDPGLGNRPGRGVPQRGDIDGAQWNIQQSKPDIRNFRFNRDYRVDLILWREILDGITDAAYLKPQLKYEILPGFFTWGALIYSQTNFKESAPGRRNGLGLEGNLGLSYASDDGFYAALQYGVLQPLDGLRKMGEGDLSRAHAFRGTVAVKF